MKRYPYKTVSEVLRLVILVLFRDVLQPYANLVVAAARKEENQQENDLARLSDQFIREVRFKKCYFCELNF